MLCFSVTRGKQISGLVKQGGSPPLLLPVSPLLTNGVTACSAVDQYASASVHGSDPRRRCADCNDRCADQVSWWRHL